MQDPKSLMLCWRSLSGCGRARVSIHFDHWGGHDIENGLWCSDVNFLQSTVSYLDATINQKSKMGIRRLEPRGIAKSGNRPGLSGTGLGLGRQQSARWDDRCVTSRTEPFVQSNPGPLAGYLEPLRTHPIFIGVCTIFSNWICRNEIFSQTTSRTWQKYI
jgi:hypothetical protein